MNNPVDCDDDLYDSILTAAMGGEITEPYASRYDTMIEQLVILMSRMRYNFVQSEGYPKGKKFRTGGYAYGSALSGVTYAQMRNEAENILGESLPNDPVSVSLISNAVHELSFHEVFRLMDTPKLECIHPCGVDPNQLANRIIRRHINRPVFAGLVDEESDPTNLREYGMDTNDICSTIATHMEIACEFNPRKYATVRPDPYLHSADSLKWFARFRKMARRKFSIRT